MIDLFKKFGIFKVFDTDPSADPNNPNPSGGEPANKDGGGGGDPAKPAEDKTPKDQLHEIVVDGNKKFLTNKELTDYAQKGFSADKKFEDAADVRKSNADAIRMKELVDRLGSSDHQPTDVEVKELAGMLGIDPTEFSKYLKEEDPPADDGKKEGKINEDALATALGMTPAEAKTILALSKQGLIDSERAKIKDFTHNMVDKDEFYGKIKVGKGGDGIIDAVKEMVAEDVFTKIEHGDVYGADLVAASIQKVRAHLIKMGIPGKPDEHPITLGLVPGLTLPSEVSSETPIERVSSAESKGEDNFVMRYIQKGLKMRRENAAKN